MGQQINAILRLRRDNDFNYAKIADTFIPANGEVCLVDTSADGLRAVCGDGVSTFSNLDFIDNLLIRAYFYEGAFYKEAEHLNIIQGSTNKLYIDAIDGEIYHYNGSNYISAVPAATAEVAGIMKLYTTTGNNEDGTMTQYAISSALNKKVEVSLDAENEELIIS
jgi:hypothetical protein